MLFNRYNLNHVKKNIDLKAINHYGSLKKYLITSYNKLDLDGFEKIQSVDDVSVDEIKNSLFFIHFPTDDEYLYHLDKIIQNNGRFIIQKNFSKSDYVYSNKYCRLALIDTLRCFNSREITHYNTNIHGNICQALDQTKNLDGDYVEIGVYRGGSALTALNYMKYANIERKSYFLDTYDGFDYEEAEQSAETHWNKWNNNHKLWGVDKTMKRIEAILSRECPKQDFTLVKSNICTDPLPEDIKKIAVANIDVDIYDATRDALYKVAEKMVTGGIIIAEDPTATPGLIGAFYAMEKFLESSVGQKFMKLHLWGQYFLIKLRD